MTKDIDVMNNCICRMIVEIAEQSIHKGGRRKDKKIVPWWTNDCSEAIKLRNKAFKVLKSNLIDQNLIEYRRMVRKIIKEAKRKCWRNFCD